MHLLWRSLSVPASVALVLGAAGCDRKRDDRAASVDAGTAPSGARPTGSVASPAPSASAPPSGERDEGPHTPPPSGGPWATCADGFRISGNPLRDVTRLGLLCGPATGMRRPEPPLEHTLTAREPWAFDVPLAAGECLRLVVATAAPAALAVATSGAPSLSATVTADQGWLVARRKGPICADESATVRVVVSSAAGGNVAVGRWFLPP